MFVVGAVIALIVSTLLRESVVLIYVVSYIIGFFMCLIYGLTTKG